MAYICFISGHSDGVWGHNFGVDSNCGYTAAIITKMSKHVPSYIDGYPKNTDIISFLIFNSGFEVKGNEILANTNSIVITMSAFRVVV